MTQTLLLLLFAALIAPDSGARHRQTHQTEPGSVSTHVGPNPGHTHPLVGPQADRASRAGRIEGRITVERRPARRQARQYGGGATSRPAQPLPTIVYLKGSMPGAAPSRATMPSMAQQDTAFAPGFLTVALGGSVTFPNRDSFFHNVFSYSPAARFDLGRYPMGETKEVLFDTPGVVKVFCEVHESMRSMILVAENAYHAEVAEDGSFVLDGVPAGTWTLVGWDMDQGSTEVEVTVRDGATARLELTIG